MSSRTKSKDLVYVMEIFHFVQNDNQKMNYENNKILYGSSDDDSIGRLQQ